MLESLKLGVLAVSRKLQFRGKGRVLKLMNLSPGNEYLVPEHIDYVECIEGIEIYTSCNRDIMFRELFINGFYQDDVLVALRHLLKPGDVFWDIGANYGFMSIYVDHIFAGTIKTVAFEPNPIVVKELRRNLGVNNCKGGYIEESCLSDRVGEMTFYLSETHSWNATLLKDFASTKNENIEINVRSSTIDAYIRTADPPSVIKIDVEGAEHLVIQGGRDFLKRSAPPLS
jgi:FkbM family methyltransferase